MRDFWFGFASGIMFCGSVSYATLLGLVHYSRKVESKGNEIEIDLDDEDTNPGTRYAKLPRRSKKP